MTRAAPATRRPRPGPKRDSTGGFDRLSLNGSYRDQGFDRLSPNGSYYDHGFDKLSPNDLSHRLRASAGSSSRIMSHSSCAC